MFLTWCVRAFAEMGCERRGCALYSPSTWARRRLSRGQPELRVLLAKSMNVAEFQLAANRTARFSRHAQRRDNVLPGGRIASARSTHHAQESHNVQGVHRDVSPDEDLGLHVLPIRYMGGMTFCLLAKASPHVFLDLRTERLTA